jgi:hypothetical protein
MVIEMHNFNNEPMSEANRDRHYKAMRLFIEKEQQHIQDLRDGTAKSENPARDIEKITENIAALEQEMKEYYEKKADSQAA